MTKFATALYGRTSKDDKKRLTIENQQGILTRWATADDGVSSVAGEYWDVGVSGKIPLSQRPEGRKLLADVRAGVVQCVAVAYIDRFGRTVLDGLQAAKELEDLGAKLVSVTEGWDSRRRDSPLNFQLRLVLAEEEHRRIRERTEDGRKRALVRDGAPSNGGPMLGYTLDARGHYIVNPAEAALIVELFSQALQGKSLLELASYAESSGVRAGRRTGKRGEKLDGSVAECHAGAKWGHSKIAAVLRNRAYKGERIWKGEVFPCPVIIDPSTWDKVQSVRATSKARGGARVSADVSLCSAVFKCGMCGTAYYHLPQQDKRPAGGPVTRHYYACAQSIRGHKCRSKRVNAGDLDAAVWNLCLAYLSDPEAIIRASLASDSAHSESLASMEAREEKIRADLAGNEKDVAEVWEAQRQHKWPLAYVAPRLDELNAHRESLLADLAELRKARASTLIDQENGSAVSQYIAGIKASLAQGLSADDKARVIRLLVAGGTITTTGSGRLKEADVVVRLRWGESRNVDGSTSGSTAANITETFTVKLQLGSRCAADC